MPGQRIAGGRCTENGCIVAADAGTEASSASDAAPELDATSAMDAAPPRDGAIASRMDCAGEQADIPDIAIEAPPEQERQNVLDELEVQNDPTANPFPLPIDPMVCDQGIWVAELEFGSAYAHVHRRMEGACEIWLGGETENPRYDGWPTQYCRFPSTCAPVTAVAGGNGGPAVIESPYCTTP